jgi:hypothetical protein
MLKRISARYLTTLTTEQLWQTLHGEFVLVFDDGEIATNAKETLYSAYAWRLHREFPKTPMLKKHHVQHTLKGGKLGSKTHLSLLGDVMWSTHDAYEAEVDGVQFRDTLAKIVYELTNEMYVDLSYRVEADVVSLDITDFIEIIDHSDISSVLDKLTPDQDSIDRAYSAITGVLSSKDKLPGNSVVKAVQAGLVDKNQILQCLGPRGYLTDIDSVIFKTPVMRGYVQGLRSFHDSLVESRSSAKSLYFSKSPLEDAEYFSRKLQLLCQIVKNLHPGDCGSQHYLTWNVRPPEYDGTIVIYKGDLEYINGKYYIDRATNKLITIKKTDKHLYNKTLEIRSVVAGCNHPDPHGICATCFGELAYSVPENTNIGHMCATSMTEKSSQSVLSVKHSDGSSVVEGITLPAEYRKYIDVTPDQYSYVLPVSLKGRSVKLIVQQVEANGLTDISLVESVNDLNITRVTAITGLSIKISDTNKETGEITDDIMYIPVNIGKRLASFTYSLLAHIKEYGWVLDSDGNIVVSMDHWDYSQPILTLPLKHYNMSEHSSEISAIIESRVEQIGDRDTDESPAATLFDLFELVNSKLTVNIGVLEVIIYSAMVVSARNNNYDLPKPWTTKGLGISGSTITGRSLSSAMGYERHRDTIVSPASFFSEHRPSTPMDAFLMPAETIADI